MHEFFNYFNSLCNVSDDREFNVGLDQTGDNPCIFEELDKAISIDEIKKSIHNLKRGKSHGETCLLNEYFIEFEEFLLPVMHKLFNCILDKGFFASNWSSSVIVPIFKKGDNSDPNNYRGINLKSNLLNPKS